ncbi:hypothetical protein ACLOJK_005056 [Asimina triloba]
MQVLSSSDAVDGKDIVSTVGNLVFFFLTMTPKKVEYLTPFGEAEAGHPPHPQRDERSPPHNAVLARPLHAANAPPPEDWVLSNSSDPSGESLNSSVTRAKFHASDRNNPLAFHLQMQLIPNGFRILKMVIFEPASDPTGHVVNYNIHMDLYTTSEGL